MMRVLITGASGLLGRHVLEAAEAAGLQVTGLCRTRQKPGLVRCDLLQDSDVERVMNEVKPEAVIHCAAERKPDVVEKDVEGTEAINVTATARVCRLADAIGAFVVYISTDYVFDGNDPPYDIDATPNPLNAYGASKLAGEKEALKYPSNVVLRVPILYGRVETQDESAVTVLFPKVRDPTSPAVMNHHERRYPTHCADVGQVIVNFLRLPKRPTGILHWSGKEEMTKFQMATAMAEVMGLSGKHIVADSKPSGGAKRPYNAHLDRAVLEGLGCASDRGFREAIGDVLKPFMN